MHTHHHSSQPLPEEVSSHGLCAVGEWKCVCCGQNGDRENQAEIGTATKHVRRGQGVVIGCNAPCPVLPQPFGSFGADLIQPIGGGKNFVYVPLCYALVPGRSVDHHCCVCRLAKDRIALQSSLKKGIGYN